MSGIARARLTEERKNFRKNRPFGFAAKPATRPDGSVDLLHWKCIIPGKDGTVCEGAKFPCSIRFTEDYPCKPPVVFMPTGFFHVNVCPHNGGVCLSILKDEVPDHLGSVPGWAPSISVVQVLIAVQELLHTPNFCSVLGEDAYMVNGMHGRAEYDRRTREQAKKYAGGNEDDD